MLHSYRMYVNDGIRKVPRLVDEGTITLQPNNLNLPVHLDQRYTRTYDPQRLWAFLERNLDLGEPGLYLSLVSTNEATVEGKRWFILTGYEDIDNQNSREISWINVSDLLFWNSGFRTYTMLTQYPSMQDYAFYVSRCFGYCFLASVDYDDESDTETISRVEFYPSIHHWHRKVMVNENGFYRPFPENEDWFMRNYPQDSGDEDPEPASDNISMEELERITDAARRVTVTLNEAAEIDFADYVEHTPWQDEDEEDENG